ncbi:MAG: toxin-antitoxin system YwqK family antitoxin, partial [Fusobacteriaceae bacterium]
MKKKLCLFLLCLFFLACGKEELIHSVELKERNGFYYKVNEENEEKEFTGTNISKYPNGQLAFEITYKNGQLHGLYKKYYENGQLEAEVNLKNGQQDGIKKTYYENGQLEVEL